MKEFKLSILEGDSTFYDGPCESLIFPATDGQVGILADHTNTISAVEAGTIMYRTPDGEEFHAAVSQGIIKIEDNEVLMLVNSAERPDEIDENRARYEAEKAKRQCSRNAPEWNIIPLRLLFQEQCPDLKLKAVTANNNNAKRIDVFTSVLFN